MPTGPPSLWAETLSAARPDRARSRSAAAAERADGIRVHGHAAPRRARPGRATGWMVPTSLFAHRVGERTRGGCEASIGAHDRRGPAHRRRPSRAPRPRAARASPAASSVAWCSASGSDDRGSDPRSRLAPAPEQALDGEVDRLGAAGREDDLDRVGVQRRGDAVSRASSSIGLRGLARRVDRRGVADEPQRVGVRGQHASAAGRGGVVEVDACMPQGRRLPGRTGRIVSTLERMPDPDCRPTSPTSACGSSTAAGTLRVWSSTRVQGRALRLLRQGSELGHPTRSRSTKGDHDIWSVTTDLLQARRALLAARRAGRRRRRTSSTRSCTSSTRTRAASPARRTATGAATCRSRTPSTGAASQKPRVALDRTVIYEAHVKGISKLNPRVPEELRGTYAGLAHEGTIEYLLDLGRHERRAAAGAAVRQRAAAAPAGPHQLLGLQHPELLHPARAVREPARRSPAAPGPCCASSRAW